VSGVIPGFGKPWAITAGWFDYNNDGLLDLFVVNYLDYDIKTAPLCDNGKLPAYCSPNNFQGTPNILYRNNGNGTFTDVSKQSHISQYVGKGMLSHLLTMITMALRIFSYRTTPFRITFFTITGMEHLQMSRLRPGWPITRAARL
jgi:hypothetical protein